MTVPSPSEPPLAEPRYGIVAIALHWLLALMIMSSFGVGLYMTGLPFSPARLKLYNWHKWAGVTIFTLSALRLLWRLGHRPPELPHRIADAMPRWQHGAHRAMHFALYALFFAVPLFGWAYTTTLGFPVVWFGVLPLPDVLPVDVDLAEHVFKPLHKMSAFLLAAVAAVHAAAALKHQFIDRDNLLHRMTPRRHEED